MIDLQKDAHKYAHDNGMGIAERLVNVFDRMDVDWAGKDVLDFGCHWGYVPLYLASKRDVNSVIGIDIEPHWEAYRQINNEAVEASDRVHLIADDLLTCEELKDRQFDIIVTAGTLFTLPIDYLEKVVDWFFDHLKPGGRVLARTRTILSYNGSDYMSPLKGLPYAHLLFPEHELRRYIKDNELYQPGSYVPFSGSTYIMLFHQAGFDIKNVNRINNQHLDWLLENHAVKIEPYDPQELNTTELVIDGVKPGKSYPLGDYWKERDKKKD